MVLTTDDLKQMSALIQPLREDISSLKGDVSALQGDVNSLKTGQQVLLYDVAVVKSDVKAVQTEQAKLKLGQELLRKQLQEVRESIETKIQAAHEDIAHTQDGLHEVIADMFGKKLDDHEERLSQLEQNRIL